MLERRIPVVMYHSIGTPDASWVWSSLACSTSLFSAHLAGLAGRGYRPATLDEVHEAQSRGDVGSERRVVLTFDDGYLDAWVYAFPLLKRAGWKGVVYVNPEFVDPGDRPRPNLEDVWAGRCAERDLVSHGFLNWAEIEMLDRSGVLEIGSHSMSHTWYPTGAGIDDYHRPGLTTPWLAWNARPERKPFYLAEDQSGFVPWGTPIHRNGRSLGIRRWIPDPDVAAAAIAHVAERGGATWFASDGWRAELDAVVGKADQGRGRLETDAEMRQRFEFEIVEAARIIEQRLGHRVGHFCWPGGAYCDESWAVAAGAGFTTLTVKRADLVRWGSPDPRFLRRISDHRQYSFLGKVRRARDGALLAAACDVELGLPGARSAMRARKLRDTLGQVFVRE